MENNFWRPFLRRGLTKTKRNFARTYPFIAAPGRFSQRAALERSTFSLMSCGHYWGSIVPALEGCASESDGENRRESPGGPKNDF